MVSPAVRSRNVAQPYQSRVVVMREGPHRMPIDEATDVVLAVAASKILTYRTRSSERRRSDSNALQSAQAVVRRDTTTPGTTAHTGDGIAGSRLWLLGPCRRPKWE